MKREYDEIMEHIQVTPEMRERVLSHIRETDIAAPSPKVLPLSSLKKYWSVAACFVLLVIGAITLPHLLDREAPEPPVQAVPQIEEAASLQELSKLVGFEVTTDFSLPFKAEKITYCSYWNEVAQIEYSGGGCLARYRQSLGAGDNSGDYNTYSDTTGIAVNDLDVTLKGDNGTYTLAIWTDESCTYSLSLSPGAKADDWLTSLTS